MQENELFSITIWLNHNLTSLKFNKLLFTVLQWQPGSMLRVLCLLMNLMPLEGPELFMTISHTPG